MHSFSICNNIHMNCDSSRHRKKLYQPVHLVASSPFHPYSSSSTRIVNGLGGIFEKHRIASRKEDRALRWSLVNLLKSYQDLLHAAHALKTPGDRRFIQVYVALLYGTYNNQQQQPGQPGAA